MTSAHIRFWAKVSKAGDDDCWEWAACVDRNGYGLFSFNSTSHYAHRVAWILAYDSIPDGLCVLHSCDNPPCVNKNHLFLGTRAENSRDMVEKGRASKGPRDLEVIPRGESHYRAILTDAKVIEIRRIYVSGDRRFGQSQLAREYGVTRRNIGKIVNRQGWRHI